MENQLISIDTEKQTTSARDLWNFLGKPYTKFTMWFDKYKEYGFIENIDYRLVSAKIHTNNPKNPISEVTDYEITIDMAKELAMLQKTEKGKQARQYFIQVENNYKQLTKKEMKRLAQREAGKIVRNMLTDAIRDKVPESPHKQFVYPNYTKLIYKILFNKTAKELREERKVPKSKNLRDFFNADELKEIQGLENIITGLISLGMGYSEIKNILSQRYVKQIA